MPPKGYKTISLKTPTAKRLAERASESGIELSIYVDALLAFTQNELYPIFSEGWSAFLIVYADNPPEEVAPK